jgi:hypothetical protein
MTKTLSLHIPQPRANASEALERFVHQREELVDKEPSTRLTMDLANSLHARLQWASFTRSRRGKKVTIADIVREFVKTLPEPPTDDHPTK